MRIDENRKQRPFIKNNFYPGKLLHAGDFIREQEYGNSKLEFLNRKFHGYGIIEGLQAVEGGGGKLLLTAGSAIDGLGRLIVVPENVTLEPEELSAAAAGEAVLGIRYAEKPVGRERSFLEKEETYQAAGIEETFALKTYTVQEWQALQGRDIPLSLAEERVLWEDGRFRLCICAPKLVPADSVFRISVQLRSLTGERAEVKWRSICRLQGAVFLSSGQSTELLEGEESIVAGICCREWQLCTEEARRFPIIVELERPEILSEHSGSVKTGNVQLAIETAADYGGAVRRHLDAVKESGVRADSGTAVQETETWVPLALLRRDVNAEDGRVSLHLLKDRELRQPVAGAAGERLLQRLQEENGIVDIRWRGLLRQLHPDGEHPPHFPENPPEPVPPPICFRRGIAVISVPRRYRRGQVLFSEEIFHGFQEKGVLVCCGRVYEDSGCKFWEKEQKKHCVVSGDEALFDGTDQGGWYIEKQAVRQNVEAGSFRIAVTLRKGRKRYRDREVAVSWTAVADG